MPSCNRHWPRWLLVGLMMLATMRVVAAAGNPLDAGRPPFPALTGPVVDNAHLLPAAMFAELSRKLAAYSRENGTQVVVVTVPTLNGYPLDYYGYELGRHWGIGQKGKNNGVVFLVDAGEHKARIDVGYGLEGTLTDAQTFLILHNVVFPRFRKGDYAGGICAGTDAILSVLGGHLQAARQQQARARGGTGFLMLLIVFFVLLPLLRAIFGGRGGGPGGYGGGWLGWLALGMLSGGGFGGGGGGGGGFGGFSGGGGSFGGGGASGSW